MKRTAFVFICSLRKRVFAVVCVFLLLFSFISVGQVSAAVECTPGTLTSSNVVVPAVMEWTSPSQIRLTNFPALFRGQRVELFIEPDAYPANTAGTNEEDTLPYTVIMVPIDANGNADLSAITLRNIPGENFFSPDDDGQLTMYRSQTIQGGQYRISIRGGSFESNAAPNDPGGIYIPQYRHPLCFTTTIQITTTEVTCQDIADLCTPGQPLNLCPKAQYAFCDASQNPARISLPTLPLAILNGAHCEYVPTPGNVTCSQARSTMPVLCSAEILGRPDGALPTTPVGEYTMCCESEVECGRAQGGTDTAGETTMVPFNACRQISVPTSGSSADAQSRAALQLSKRNDCCKCMTGDQSSTFIDADQRCSGEAEAAADNSIEAAESRGIYTAIGCVSTSVTSDNGMIAQLVRIGLGLAGGLALLMILAGGFIYSTSQGDPKKANEAKELITSAVMGLLFIIFSVTLLQFIGVSVLQIPGFGS